MISRFAVFKSSEQLNRRFCSRDHGQPFLEFWSLLGEEFYHVFPCKRIRRHDGPLLAQGGGGKLECATLDVNTHRRETCHGVVAADRAAWGTRNGPIDVPVRARRGRSMDLAKAEGELWVNGRNVEVRVVPFEVCGNGHILPPIIKRNERYCAPP